MNDERRRGEEEEEEEGEKKRWSQDKKRYGFYDFGMELLNLSMDLWFCMVIILSKPRVC